jgi:diaminopimelate epimerase
MTSPCHVTTMQGLGNVLHIIKGGDLPDSGREQFLEHLFSQKPADGLLAYGTDGRVVTWNRDGSAAELCGNGLRCLARLGMEEGWLDPETDQLQTDAGVHAIRSAGDGSISISMPMPCPGPAAVGMQEGELETQGDAALLQWEGGQLQLHLIATGNPHAILFVSVEEHAALLPVIGPMLEQHAAFPAGINVHCAAIDTTGMVLSSWERGVGVTQACATGATASVFAAYAAGMLEGACTVHMPGGELIVELDDTVAWNTGPAEYVERWVFE